jgi:sigma-E factor negative regulatory protein RseB
MVSDPAMNWPMFLDQSFRGLSAKSDVYQLKLLDRKRIAEFTGQQLDIVATDDFRYGYSVWLESESGLLLQWQLNDNHGNSLAKLVFTEMKIGTEVNQSELRASHHNAGKAKSSLPVDTAMSASLPGNWSPGWLPPGFRMMASRAPQTGLENGFQHQVYSDGIASISLYLEPDDGAADSGLGLRQLGTSHIFGRKADGIMVTVVGDVPAITVEKIAQSVDFSQ